MLFRSEPRTSLCLIQRHHGVFLAVQENDGCRQSLDEMDGRAFVIERALRPIRLNQPIEVMRFELMGVGRERDEIANALVARTGCETASERQRA